MVRLELVELLQSSIWMIRAMEILFLTVIWCSEGCDDGIIDGFDDLVDVLMIMDYYEGRMVWKRSGMEVRVYKVILIPFTTINYSGTSNSE
jgi:hypothetical protein